MSNSGQTEPGTSRDRTRLTACVLAFGVALGATGLAFPLLALEAGYGATAVGLLAALSAAVQMVSKMSLSYLFTRFTDKSLMVGALAVMALSAAVLLMTTALAGFVVAQGLQGVARGIFWTSGQTHSVRMPGIATRQLAFVQTVGKIGGFLGPAIAGTLATISLAAALIAASAIAVCGLLVAITLEVLPTYQREPRHSRTPIWRATGIGLGCWGGGIGGAWRGILDSFVPVVLESAGMSSRVIGWLMSTADGSSLVATAAVAKWGDRRSGRFIPLAALGLGAGLVLLPNVEHLFLVTTVLILSGLSAGFAAVLGTASVNESAKASDQGAALALVGVYRAGARAAAPATISGVLFVVSLPVALVMAAAGVVVPGLWLRRPQDHPKTTSSRADPDH